MTLEQFIKANHDGNQAAYARAQGFTAPLVNRLIKRGCLVDSTGWPHPSLNKRKLKGD